MGIMQKIYQFLINYVLDVYISPWTRTTIQLFSNVSIDSLHL